MKKGFFSAKIFILSMTVCALVAGLFSYVMNEEFWTIFAVVVIATLINGIVAGFD